METTAPEIPDPERDDESGPSGLPAIFGPTVNAVFAPAAAYDTLDRRPSLAGWVMVWIIVGLMFAGWANMDVTRQFARVGMIQGMQQQMAQSGQEIDTERLREMVETVDRFAPAWAIGGNLFIVIAVLVIAVLIWGGATMFGGSAKFSRALGVASVGAVIHPLMATFFTTFMWWMSPPEIRRIEDIAASLPTLGLDLVLGSPDMSFAMRTLLQRVDLFNAWWVILVVMGAERLLRVKRGGAIGLAVGIWALTTAMSVGWASLGGS